MIIDAEAGESNRALLADPARRDLLGGHGYGRASPKARRSSAPSRKRKPTITLPSTTGTLPVAAVERQRAGLSPRFAKVRNLP